MNFEDLAVQFYKAVMLVSLELSLLPTKRAVIFIMNVTKARVSSHNVQMVSCMEEKEDLASLAIVIILTMSTVLEEREEILLSALNIVTGCMEFLDTRHLVQDIGHAGMAQLLSSSVSVVFYTMRKHTLATGLKM